MSSIQLKTLVSDINELVEFLGELGGESLAIDSDFLSATKIPASSGPANVIAKTVAPQIQKATAPPMPVRESGPETPPAAVPKKDFTSVLANTKLSSLSEVTGSKSEPRRSMAETRPVAPAQSTDESKTMKKSKDLSVHTTLEEIKKEIGACTRCGLCEERTQVVHSIGNPDARLMFIGEAPGADEDAKGEPFVGRAGQLLTRIIDAMGFQREDVFIGNINRCRPPGNRAPKIDEADQCRPFLLREIEIVKPEVIVVMGNTACQNLLNTKDGITKLRGNFQDYFGVKVMPTFHPAYLLRDPSKKKLVWEDMKQVMELLKSEGSSS